MFTYHVFFFHPPLYMQKNIFKINLKVKYKPEGTSPDLNIYIADDTNSLLHYYNWETLFGENWTLENVLHDFEYAFLEVPMIEVTNHGGRLASYFVDNALFNTMYNELKLIHKNRREKGLAWAMSNHKRLAQNSKAYVLPHEILQRVMSMHNEAIPEYQAMLEDLQVSKRYRPQIQIQIPQHFLPDPSNQPGI